MYGASAGLPLHAQVLKAAQALEAAMAAAGEQPAQQAVALRGRIDTAEAEAVAPVLLRSARSLLRRCLVAEAEAALEAALRPPRIDASTTQRVDELREALDKAEVRAATLCKQTCALPLVFMAAGSKPASRGRHAPSMQRLSLVMAARTV
jgi:hypothetical protein